ncbi:plantaricin C family lantibiotic [Halalkalibacterium halodurans]|jgi:hypothetical protein|uniref:Lantibiotic mersacidin n=2 Tax=Halalkalibacterium halodurans TaxID=86665 RepID=Q9KFM5_HALH5|nr:plantaricin C family lantibiotic [Halalkalibacterium halodurans]MDY7220954.1 plantaricin C family lantibiotic [Halalkalibacterium halodurans]MDY7240193.1 plantaricin C family lantibiotic [Halalkalibacterium halodurans]MED4082500.1 plantaricin C family lantibiotic [Halalkalibacterium halodurans]MED4085745.1 plantaricin C family lantibiotic [Halalkalibacterium halodurans]MED4105611.1 plantaricin C family lantibiotic [Halalkalibacterium halodurans]
MTNLLKEWKMPLERTHNNSNPAGDIFQELEDQDILAGVNGACAWYNISCRLGNKGAYCTLTVECMPSCN